jgi:hypothetical protein
MILTRQEAIDKLLEEDLDCIITGNQERDNSYLFGLLQCGFKGYNNYNNKNLMRELYERFGTGYTIKG